MKQVQYDRLNSMRIQYFYRARLKNMNRFSDNSSELISISTNMVAESEKAEHCYSIEYTFLSKDLKNSGTTEQSDVTHISNTNKKNNLNIILKQKRKKATVNIQRLKYAKS